MGKKKVVRYSIKVVWGGKDTLFKIDYWIENTSNIRSAVSREVRKFRCRGRVRVECGTKTVWCGRDWCEVTGYLPCDTLTRASDIKKEIRQVIREEIKRRGYIPKEIPPEKLGCGRW